jgi:hypothetical protein
MLGLPELQAARHQVVAARRAAAAAQAQLAAACVEYADTRIEAERQAIRATGGRGRVRPGEFVADEVSAADAAAIDATLAALARNLGAEDPRTEQQRRSDLFADLLLGRLRFHDNSDDDNEEDEQEGPETARSSDTAIDSGPAFDPGPAFDTESASDAGLASDVESGFDSGPASDSEWDREYAASESQPSLSGSDAPTSGLAATVGEATGSAGWLEMEQIDPDTGELLGTRWQRLDADGEPVDEPVVWPDGPFGPPSRPPTVRSSGRPLRIGIVVPLTSLLNLEDTPGELADRSALIPAEFLRQLIAETLGPDDSRHDGVLFTRLLTDSRGRLLDTTELGRHPSRRLAEAIMIRAGTCRFPTCTVPAERCDLDHHQPWPHGPTSASNLDPLCRRHHRGKTFAWQASLRDHDEVDWTMPDAHHYRCEDEPLPIGLGV